jgi:hypothetical protein
LLDQVDKAVPMEIDTQPPAIDVYEMHEPKDVLSKLSSKLLDQLVLFAPHAYA